MRNSRELIAVKNIVLILTPLLALLTFCFAIYKYHDTITINAQKPYLEGVLNVCSNLSEYAATAYVYNSNSGDTETDIRSKEAAEMFQILLEGRLKLFGNSSNSEIVRVANLIGNSMKSNGKVNYVELDNLTNLCYERLRIDWGLTS